MILTLLLIAAQILFGYTLVSWANIKASQLERFLYAIVTGFIVGSWLSFILQLILGLNNISIILSIIVMFIVSVRTIVKISNVRFGIAIKRYKFKKLSKAIRENKLPIVFFLFLLSMLLFLNYKNNLEPRSDGLYTAKSFTFADLPGHLAIINSFLENSNKNLEYIDFAYSPMVYHFMMDFGTAVFVAGGLATRESLILTGTLFPFIGLLLFYFLARAIVKNRKIALLALLLFVFMGGLGFIYFFEDWQSTKLFQIRDYSHYPEKNIHFPNLFSNLLLAWRPFIIGFPVLFMVSTVLWRWLGRKANNRELTFSAFNIGLLPLFNLSVFFSISVVSAILFLFRLKYEKKDMRIQVFKSWVLFFMIVVLVSFPQLIWISQKFTGDSGGTFIGIKLGWLAEDQNFLMFWIFNVGVPFILALPGFLLIEKKFKLIYISFAVLFFIGNIVRLQPYIVDNIKLFYLWIPINSILVANLIHRMFAKNYFLKVLCIILVLSSILSGLTSIISNSQTSARLYGKGDIELGEWIKENTPKNAVFLTNTGHDIIASTLAGRRILMGHVGFVWAKGVNYGDRLEDIKKMYSGYNATELLRKYNVSYVVIGPGERGSFNPNETFFDDSFQIVKELDGYKIYKV